MEIELFGLLVQANIIMHLY